MESDDFETTVFIRQNQERSIEVDISDRIGVFTPTIFLYLSNISEINVHGCQFIDPNLFVDTIVYCEFLCKLDMENCNQFSELNLVTFLPKMKELKSVNLARCCNLGFDSVLWIINETRKLELINFDPKDALKDVKMWELLLRHFLNIQFGHNVRCCMPHYGNEWRIPYSSDDNDLD